MTRRGFLTTLALAAPGLALPAPATAEALAPRALRFSHTHTGERLEVEYFGPDGYRPDALTEVDRFLRDFRTGDIHPIAPALLDFLHRLDRATGSSRVFEVISGYRSPVTNASLRSRSEGVASRSLHMEGRAIDIRIPGVRLVALRDAALAARLGGVGYYPASNFVHVDTGRVRRW